MIDVSTDRASAALAAHRQYREAGYATIPILLERVVDDRRGRARKRPKFPGGSWAAAARVDPALAVRDGYADIAMVLDRVVGLDFDIRHNEDEGDAWERCERARQRYQLTGAISERSGNGYHLIARAPAGEWKRRIWGAPHLVDEVRCGAEHGHRLLLFVAPSWHPVAERFYERDGPLVPVDDLPECPAELLEEPLPSPPEPAKDSTVRPQANGRGDWSTLDVVALFQAEGLYLRKIGNARHGVICPWEAAHTTGGDGTDTAVFERTRDRGPGFRCLHAHCEHRDIRDVRVYFGYELVDRHCTEPFRPDPAVARGVEGHDGEKKAASKTEAEPSVDGVVLKDFHAYMPTHSYIFAPSRDLWPAASVNARISPVPILDEHGNPVLDGNGKAKTIKATLWLDRNCPREQMTWAPGEPMLIEDRLVSHGGWIERRGCGCFNLYLPPTIDPGDAAQAERWLGHIHRVYPTEAEHIIAFLAHRVQRPQEKINHGLVLGGLQGIGKDTLLEPVKHAIGPWNFVEVSPAHLLGRFNGFIKSVILRISEARDLGNIDRFSFYDHLKAYTAAPPDVLRCDEKNIREYNVFNVCAVVLTTNHKTDGIYLPADDRRHFVAWSELTKEDFTEDYWRALYAWYERGGHRHVAAYLAELDISGFQPKAPPPKTDAFWDIVDANRAPEDAELADALDAMDGPDATTLSQIAGRAVGGFGEWLKDRRNSRQIPHRMESAGYVAVRNSAAKDGKWKVGGRRQVIYANAQLSVRDRIEAARCLAEASR